MTKLGLSFGAFITGIFILAAGGNHPSESNFVPDDAEAKRAIVLYVDSVNRLLPKSKKESSLQYSLGNYNFQIFRYSYQNVPLLYVEKGLSENSRKVERRYYVRNNRLELYSEKTEPDGQPGPYISTNVYFRNDQPIHSERKVAMSSSALDSVAFKEAGLAGQKEQVAGLTALNDAVEQKGVFDLVFDGMAESPQTRYIILGKDGFRTLRATIRVESDDEFIHELSTNTQEYRGEKLDISWAMNSQNEMVYRNGRLRRD